MANVLDMDFLPAILYILVVTILLMVVMAFIGKTRLKLRANLFVVAMLAMLPLGFAVAAIIYLEPNLANVINDLFGQFGG